MAMKVNTGWRTVTPGKCMECGERGGWDCDGRGTIYCQCQTCPDCGMFDGHEIGCDALAEMMAQDEETDDD